MISETFKRQPKGRKWGTVIFFLLSVIFIISSFLIHTGIFFEARTELSPFLSLTLLIIFFGSFLGSKLGVWGVVIGLLYSFIADVLLPDCFGYGDCGPHWLFPPLKTMWVIIPSLFFALLGFLIECLIAPPNKTS